MSDEAACIRGAKITVTCPSCGTDVEYVMSPDEARATAGGLLAVADDMPSIRMTGVLEVKGHG